jgi:protein tyrosine phosphatase (PTP) superfamily phosphohydrolase (DUF442 family)
MKRGSWGAGEIGAGTVLSVSPRVGSREKNLLDVFLTDVVPGNESLRKIRAGRYVRAAGRKVGIDITWIDDRIAVGGGIWNADNMAALSRAGITHIIDMQIEFDDTPLAVPFRISVCWNPVDDDFEPKPAAVFKRGVDFALAALKQHGTKVLVHCAAGVHRAPMMTLALLGVLGWTVEDAMEMIENKRPVADFADVYVQSVERFLNGRG